MKPDLLNRVLAGLQVILVEPERAREIAGDLHDDVAEATVSSPLVAGGGDWTAKDGTSNTSTRFLDLVDAVAHLIRDSAFTLISGDTQGVARLIMAQLAHVHGLMPVPVIPTDRTEAMVVLCHHLLAEMVTAAKSFDDDFVGEAVHALVMNWLDEEVIAEDDPDLIAATQALAGLASKMKFYNGVPGRTKKEGK